jgi:hypothetical protein
MRLNNLLQVAMVPASPSIHAASASVPMPVDAVDRIMNMVDASPVGGTDTSPTNGRPLFVRLPQGDVPMIAGVQLRTLVDRLGLGILPESYVNAEVRGGDTAETRKAVSAFKRVCGPKNDYYIVAPMETLDPSAMATDEDRPTYIAPSERPMYRSLFGMMPMARSLSRRVARLEERVAVVEDGVKELRRDLQRMRQEQEVVRRQSEERAARWALSRDPMIVALPKGVDPATAEVFLAGPAWGPEFGPDELRSLGIECPARSVADELSPLLAKLLG